jgi:hypothetical protein
LGQLVTGVAGGGRLGRLVAIDAGFHRRGLKQFHFCLFRKISVAFRTVDVNAMMAGVAEQDEIQRRYTREPGTA